jgi:hypothetical protein
VKIVTLKVITFDAPNGQAVMTMQSYEHDRGPISERTKRLAQSELDDLMRWIESLT